MELLNLSKLEDMGIDTDFRIVQVGVVVRGYGGFTQLDRMSPGIKPPTSSERWRWKNRGNLRWADRRIFSEWLGEERSDGLLLRYHNEIKAGKPS